MGGAAAAEAATGGTQQLKLSRRLVALYLAAVVLIAIARAVDGHPSLSALALTPDRLGHGQVWLIVTSGLIVNGPVWPQVAALAVTIVAALRRLGAAFSLTVMVMAHVGATLLAYALLALATGDADGAHNRELDYGTSAVWLGLVGALTADSLSAARRGGTGARVLAAAGCVAFVVGVTVFPLLAAFEHGLAFALGAGLAVFSGRRSAAHRSVRSVASTASSPTASA